jgi:membrane-associated phospholipid phosphatase
LKKYFFVVDEKRFVKGILLVLAVLCCFTVSAQQPDTLIKKLDSLKAKADTTGQKNVIKREAYNENTRIDAGTYFTLLASDARQQFTKPFHMHGKDWKRLGAGALVIGGFALTDESVQKFMLKLRDRNPWVHNVSEFVTNTGGPYEAITLGAITSYGILFKNEKLKTTGLLASQSYITSAAIQTILKLISGRQRPYVYHPDQVEVEPKFHGPFHSPFRDINGKRLSSSFPSGHTTGAFAAATVFAMEYSDRPLVRIIAYSSASLIGLSRITENKHWVSDVLAGAALGLLSGRQVVNNYHRFATIRNARERKGSVTFSLDYQMGVVLPKVIYSFR